MKKLCALVFGIVVLVGCGGEPPVEVAKEAFTSQIGATFFDDSMDFVETVPLGTDPLVGVPGTGARASFGGSRRQALFTDSNFDNNVYRGVSISYQGDGTNNIQCSLIVQPVTVATSSLAVRFPSSFLVPYAAGQTAVAGVHLGGTGYGGCAFRDNILPSRAPRYAVVAWLPYSEYFPSPSNNKQYLRVDLDIPEFGVTARYYFRGFR